MLLKFLSWFGLGRPCHLKEIRICNDVWLDILPFFGRPQLGLQLAPLSFRFDALVDKHFSVTKQLTIWRSIKIHKDSATEEAKLSVAFENKYVPFPMPEFPLPVKIRFLRLRIWYINHSVIKFLNQNNQIFGKVTHFGLELSDEEQIWEVVIKEIWPIFVTTNIRRLDLFNAGLLNNLRRLISPTILTDLPLLSSIYSEGVVLNAIPDDGPNATAGQALSKWLHTPTTDGQPKRLHYYDVYGLNARELVTSFKEAFLRSTTSICHNFELKLKSSAFIEPFELVNERTNEVLTLEKNDNFGPNQWLMKRCRIGETTQKKSQNLDNFIVDLLLFDQSIGPLSPSFGSSVPIGLPQK